MPAHDQLRLWTRDARDARRTATVSRRRLGGRCTSPCSSTPEDLFSSWKSGKFCSTYIHVLFIHIKSQPRTGHIIHNTPTRKRSHQAQYIHTSHTSHPLHSNAHILFIQTIHTGKKTYSMFFTSGKFCRTTGKKSPWEPGQTRATHGTHRRTRAHG